MPQNYLKGRHYQMTGKKNYILNNRIFFHCQNDDLTRELNFHYTDFTHI